MIGLPELRAGRMRREQGFCHPVEGLELPFGLLEGPEPGPVLLVTAGVHGAEYCSIEAALRLLRIDPAILRGTLLVLPILNGGGFRARSIYVMPEDGRNLNRMFPGRPDGTASEKLAHWLVTAVYPRADAYLDLHGGDLSEALVPFSLFPSGSAASETLAGVFGLPVAVAAGGEGGSPCRSNSSSSRLARVSLPGDSAAIVSHSPSAPVSSRRCGSQTSPLARAGAADSAHNPSGTARLTRAARRRDTVMDPSGMPLHDISGRIRGKPRQTAASAGARRRWTGTARRSSVDHPGV